MTSMPFVEAPVVCSVTFGRQPLLAHLSQRIDQLVLGRGGTALVTGEAGIGKTRLVGEARSVASGRCMNVGDVSQALIH
jgi:hypothetical protein